MNERITRRQFLEITAAGASAAFLAACGIDPTSTQPQTKILPKTPTPEPSPSPEPSNTPTPEPSPTPEPTPTETSTPTEVPMKRELVSEASGVKYTLEHSDFKDLEFSGDPGTLDFAWYHIISQATDFDLENYDPELLKKFVEEHPTVDNMHILRRVRGEGYTRGTMEAVDKPVRTNEVVIKILNLEENPNIKEVMNGPSTLESTNGGFIFSLIENDDETIILGITMIIGRREGCKEYMSLIDKDNATYEDIIDIKAREMLAYTALASVAAQHQMNEKGDSYLYATHAYSLKDAVLNYEINNFVPPFNLKEEDRPQ